MIRQLLRLEKARAQFANVPAFLVDAKIRVAVVEGLCLLDAAIAQEAKHAAYSESLPETFDLERFATDFCMGVVQ